MPTENLFASGQNGYDTYRIPALITTPAGAVLAFCEGRKHTGRDDDDDDMPSHLVNADTGAAVPIDEEPVC